MSQVTRRRLGQRKGDGRRTAWRFALAALGAVATGGVLLLGPVGVGVGAAAADEDGGAIFGQLCQGCHTMGGGDGVGPDLEGLADRREAEWVKQFILDPQAVIDSGDPIAKELVATYGTTMPSLGVTEAQIGPLLAFLGFSAEAPPTETETTPTETAPTETETAPTETETAPVETTPAPSAGDAEQGEDLFTGADRFDEGGPACLSCHSVAGVGALGGGQLGPDLTGSYAKFGGEQGLRAALETTPFPTMAPIFSRKPLTAAERDDLVAFLAGAPDQQRPARSAGKLVGFSVVAAAGMVILGMGIWRRRLNGVRKPLVNRSRRK